MKGVREQFIKVLQSQMVGIEGHKLDTEDILINIT